MELLNVSISQNCNLQFNINILLIIIICLVILIIVLYINKNSKTKLKKLTVNVPFGIGSVELTPDATERNAAWSLYIELITRIAVQKLRDDEGLVREALSSLYSLFPTTRQILKDAGPNAGISRNSVGGIAIDVLNIGLRPFLAKWHPLLQEWEAKRAENISLKEHEKSWPRERELRGEIETLRSELKLYAEALERIADIKR
jgi:hypothetical protein